MNATFSLTLVIFCHIYHPHPHGYYRGLCPHYRGFTADLPLSPSPCSSLPDAARCDRSNTTDQPTEKHEQIRSDQIALIAPITVVDDRR